jgi:hypothetical protein
MADLVTCQTCGTPNQEVGKYCEQCGSKVELTAAPPAASTDAPLSADAAPAPQVDDTASAMSNNGAAPPVVNPSDNGSAASVVDDVATAAAPVAVDATVTADAPAASSMVRFIRMDNGVFVRDHAFDVPIGSRLLVGRADPANGVFPEVDVTMWSKRVPTPEGSLYTVHRRQCYISRDDAGQVWIVDHADYVGDTMVSPVGTSQFRPIPSFSGERPTNAEGAVSLDVGDRILMGQGEGMLIFQLMRV